jgi:Methyltransferase domain
MYVFVDKFLVFQFIVMNGLVRKLWYALTNPGRVAILDYPVKPAPSYTPETTPHEKLYQIISRNDRNYLDLAKNSLRHKSCFGEISLSTSDETLPSWENGFLPAIDTIMLYTILEKFKPKKYLEIGSGNSTRLAAFCRKKEKLYFSITCIDPNPRKEIERIADKWINKQIQLVSLDQFKNLEPNDVVFLDGSHVLHPNSDVMWFFMEILPVIPKGVIIHIHDIFLPYDYPQWVCDRFFNEQYILAACLLNSDNFKIISPNYYVLTRKIAKDVWAGLWELPALKNVKKYGRSFWFSKT